jgi:putative thioredoxin
MDVTASSFERDVLQGSAGTLVLVDFWAPWCAPCRSLTPILEKLEREYAGRVALAKVNSDEQPELASAFGIRSIPTVIAFRDGQPVSQFMGALPESQVRAFIDGLLPSASELERRRAALLRESGDRAGALAALEKALAHDAANDLAHLDIAQLLLDEGDAEGAERHLAQVRPNIDWDARAEALRAAVGFARAGGSEKELLARLAANPDDHEARLQLAQRHAGARRYADAMEALLEIVRRDKTWRDGEARKQLLHLFTLAAGEPQLVSEYRRRLATVLY